MIKLRKWATLMIIAPLSANSLAKIANGFCDNLLVNNNNYFFYKLKKKIRHQ